MTLKTTGKKLSWVCSLAMELRMMRDVWYCRKLQHSYWNGIVAMSFFSTTVPEVKTNLWPLSIFCKMDEKSSSRLESSIAQSVCVWIRLSVFVSPHPWPTAVLPLTQCAPGQAGALCDPEQDKRFSKLTDGWVPPTWTCSCSRKTLNQWRRLCSVSTR